MKNKLILISCFLGGILIASQPRENLAIFMGNYNLEQTPANKETLLSLVYKDISGSLTDYYEYDRIAIGILPDILSKASFNESLMQKNIVTNLERCFDLSIVELKRDQQKCRIILFNIESLKNIYKKQDNKNRVEELFKKYYAECPLSVFIMGDIIQKNIMRPIVFKKGDIKSIIEQMLGYMLSQQEVNKLIKDDRNKDLSAKLDVKKNLIATNSDGSIMVTISSNCIESSNEWNGEQGGLKKSVLIYHINNMQRVIELKHILDQREQDAGDTPLVILIDPECISKCFMNNNFLITFIKELNNGYALLETMNSINSVDKIRTSSIVKRFYLVGIFFCFFSFVLYKKYAVWFLS